MANDTEHAGKFGRIDKSVRGNASFVHIPLSNRNLRTDDAFCSVVCLLICSNFA